MNESITELPLFEESQLSGIQPTGSPWILNEQDPATVVVPLPVIITSVNGPYTARDRKLWTFLLHVTFDELGKSGGHSVKISDINSVFRKLGGEHSTDWIWESAKRLAKTTIEFETTYGDERYDTITSLFYATVPRKGKRGSELHFGFPEPLIPVIREPYRFSRLRVHFLLKLSGKYAITLYEVLEGYVNRYDEECRVTIEDLRRWLKVTEGTYQNWKDLRKWVIDPAIKQINDDPEGSGLTVEYEPIRKGRFYNEIIFKLKKTEARKQIEKSIRKNSTAAKAKVIAKASGRPHLREAAIQKATEKTRYILDMDEMKAQFWAHWESTGRAEFTKGVDAAFIGFCEHKLSQMNT